MPGLGFQLLGRVGVTVDDRPFDGWHIRPAFALCAYLACRPERHPREHLMELLWPDFTSASAHKNLRQSLYVLRQALPQVVSATGDDRHVPLIVADRTTVQLNPDAAVTVDARRFASLLNGPRVTFDQVVEAVALYRGDFLSDFYLPDSNPFEEWVAAQRAELRRLMLDALDRLAAEAEARGRYEESAAYARRQLEMDNLREGACRQLMLALARVGQRAEALAVYERCRRCLQEELRLEPAAETRELAERIGHDQLANGSARFAGRVERPLSNLPSHLSSFIGREREIAETGERLAVSRLVTLTGPGGGGKTRLAVEVARSLQGDFPDGVWLVEFAALTEPGLVGQTVAESLGLHDLSGRPVQKVLVEHLRSRTALLVLDNCEHLIDASARFAQELLEACPGLHILATSREPLRITGEVVRPVPPLAVATEGHLSALADLAEIESIRLFTDRATAVKANFRLTEDNAAAIASICRHLDGMPLAIELAAARVEVLSLAEIGEHLADRFRLLTHGSRTVLPRQQTLRATIDWSYGLLSEVEQALLAQLSVFSGGWTLEAAEAVCSISAGRVLDTLSALVDKSLVQSAESMGMARFSMLETIRQYGSERPQELAEQESARRRHLAYFLDFAERGERGSHSRQSLDWKRRMDSERDNLRTALDYTFSVDGLSDAVVRLTRALGGFNGVWSSSSWQEAGYWTEKVLAHPDATPATALRARLLFNAAIFDRSGSPERQRSHFEESLAIFDALDEADGVERATLLMWIGYHLSHMLDEREKGLSYMQEAIRVFEDSGEQWHQAFALNLYAGTIFEVDRDFAVAWALVERGLEVARKTGEQFLIAVLTDDFGIFAVEHGLFDQGQDYLEEALEVYRRFKGFAFACQTLKWLGDAALGLGDFQKAGARYRESLAMTQDVGMLNFGINVRLSLGLTVVHQGDVQQALSLFTEALDVAHETRKPDFPKFTAFYFLDCVAAALAVQGRADAAARFFGAFDAQFEAFLAEGFTRGRLFDAIDLQEHEHFLALCRHQIDQATFDGFREEGRTLTLEEAVEFGLQYARAGASLPAMP